MSTPENKKRRKIKKPPMSYYTEQDPINPAHGYLIHLISESIKSEDKAYKNLATCKDKIESLRARMRKQPQSKRVNIEKQISKYMEKRTLLEADLKQIHKQQNQYRKEYDMLHKFEKLKERALNEMFQEWLSDMLNEGNPLVTLYNKYNRKVQTANRRRKR